MAQSVKRPFLVLAQVTISQFREFKLYVALCAGSRKPAWDSVSASLSAPTQLALSLSLKINKNKLKKKKKGRGRRFHGTQEPGEVKS